MSFLSGQQLHTRPPAAAHSFRSSSSQRSAAPVTTCAAKTGQGSAAPSTNFKLLGSGPKPFGVSPSNILRLTGASLPILLRFGSGIFGQGYSSNLVEDDGKYGVVKLGGRRVNETSKTGTFKRPAKLIQIYEFEGCPFCRKLATSCSGVTASQLHLNCTASSCEHTNQPSYSQVREAVTILDLDVEFRPCPAGGPTWREEVRRKGGKASFPYMVDSNTGKSMYESDDIVKYLFQKYGDGNVPLGLRLGILTALSCSLALLPRLGAGSRYQPSKQPKQPLELWSYEGSPFCKIVKEKLCQLELAHVQHTVSRGSARRQLLVDAYGKFAVPYFEDPNQRVAMFESADIIDYLEKTYAA